MRRDPHCPNSETTWELRYHDYFDPDPDSSSEAEGVGIVEGLVTLWRKEALEGVADDGSSTFTTFTIWWGNRTVFESAGVHRDPFVRPGLKNIRRWRSQDLFEEIATAHLRLLQRRNEGAGASGDESKPILELAEKGEDVDAFRKALRKL